MKKIIILFVLIFSTIVSGSEILNFDPVPIEELSQLRITSIVQDETGFIWIGSENGLHRYDGHELISFRYNHKDPQSISHDLVSSTLLTDNNDMWIATSGGGVCRLDKNTGRFSRYILDKKEISSKSFVSKLIYTKSGILYAGTLDGLFRFNEGSDKFDPVLNTYPENPFAIWDIVEHDNKLIVGTPAGMRFISISDNTLLEEKEYIEKPLDIPVVSLYKTIEGMILIGTDSTVLAFDPAQKKIIDFQTYSGLRFPLDKALIYTIYENKTDLYFGTNKGLVQIRNDKSGLYLKGQLITSINFDRSGVLWIGTSQSGLKKYSKFKNKFSFRNIVSSFVELEKVTIMSLVESTGYYWAGTRVNGLYKIDKSSGTYINYSNDLTKNSGKIADNTIKSLHLDQEGTLWIGTIRGLNFLMRSGDNKNFGLYTSDSGSEVVLSANNINCIFRDSNGLLWVGTTKGLNCIDLQNKTVNYYNSKKGEDFSLTSDWITSINEDNSGNIWIGTLTGLNKLDKNLNKLVKYYADYNEPGSISFNDITDIMIERSGDIWIGTWSGGLNRYLSEDDSFSSITTDEGFLSNTINGIIPGGNNHIWVSTNRGISRFNKKTGKIDNYTNSDGIRTVNTFYRSRFKSRTGGIYFFGRNDVSIIKEENIIENTYIPEIVITSVSVNGKQNNDNLTEMLNKKSFVFSYKKKNFQIKFASLDYNLPEKNQYAYRVDTIDEIDEWHYIDNENKIMFFTLPHGENRVYVKGSNSEGLWNNAPTWVDIEIIPPFWETIWFKILLILVGSVLFIKLYRIKLKIGIRKMEYKTRVDYFCKKNNISIREKELLVLMIEGKSNKEIEDILFISSNTVRNHVYNIYQKLNIRKRVQLLKMFETEHNHPIEGS